MKLEEVIPAPVIESLARELKRYEDACRAQNEMHTHTQNPAAHRLAYEFQVKAALSVQRALGEAMKHLEERAAGSGEPS